MNPENKHTGDDGYTGILGKGRVPKNDVLIEALGTLDETSSVLGMARTNCQTSEARDWLIQIQRDLYMIMSEIAATKENLSSFQRIGQERVAWLEEKIQQMEADLPPLTEFILPGDSQPGAVLDLARTVTRRAERRMVELYQKIGLPNQIVIQYLNRLSTFCFTLERVENRASGSPAQTLAKKPKSA